MEKWESTLNFVFMPMDPRWNLSWKLLVIMSVYKKRGTLLYPFTYARAVGATPTTTPSRTGEVSQGKTEAQDNQSNAKAKTIKSRGTK